MSFMSVHIVAKLWLVGWCVGSFAKQLHVTKPHAYHPKFVVVQALGSINIASAF